jgi:DNA-binding transcriptional ArsR family regulator
MGMIIPVMGMSSLPNASALSPPLGLGNALFSKVQQRVLGILYGNPDRSFYANEIISLADSGTGAVQRELGKLAEAGLATVRRQGNQKHYQANAASPVFNELRGLVLKTFGLVDVCVLAWHRWRTRSGWRLSMARWPSSGTRSAATLI